MSYSAQLTKLHCVSCLDVAASLRFFVLNDVEVLASVVLTDSRRSAHHPFGGRRGRGQVRPNVRG